jgi:hypothetical protein
LQADQERVKQILKIENMATEDRYLGLATREGRMSKDKFKTIKERLIQKYNNWVERNMSSGAKDVMIKAVAQAIPTYTMGVFKLPATLCKELMQLTRYFFGGRGDVKHRKVHWIAWDTLLLSKNMGGGDGVSGPKTFQSSIVGTIGVASDSISEQYMCKVS